MPDHSIESLAKELEVLKKRYERLDPLIVLLSHGESKIYWADYKVIKVEKIITEAVIDK